MTIDILQQAHALAQALLLGAVFGAIYDIMRVIRCRIPNRLLEGILDFFFWILVIITLFLWSQKAWGGQIRLYGALFCLLGGWLYFQAISRIILFLGYRTADFIALFLGILTLPFLLFGALLKIFEELAKNIFLSGAKWVKIKQKPEEMKRAVRRRAAEERRETNCEVQAGRIDYQACNSGADDLYGNLSAGFEESNSRNPTTAEQSGTDGVRPEN